MVNINLTMLPDLTLISGGATGMMKSLELGIRLLMMTNQEKKYGFGACRGMG